jgi:hypothetical protein
MTTASTATIPNDSWLVVRYQMKFGSLKLATAGNRLWLQVMNERNEVAGLANFDPATREWRSFDCRRQTVEEPLPTTDKQEALKCPFDQWLRRINCNGHCLSTYWYSNKGPLVIIADGGGQEIGRAYFDFVGGCCWQILGK